MKTTLWEGGVRGTGFIYSPLLKTSGYVSNHMMHVCDWLPTLYTVAGGDVGVLTNSDGINMWETLSVNGKSHRTEILHNIDPMQNNSALRMGDYKIIVGDIGMKWDGWYPPWQNPDDHIDNGKYVINNYSVGDSDSVQLKSEFLERNKHYTPVEMLSSDYNEPSKSTLQNSVIINCGKKPMNASTNCDPVKSPCLFNIAKDPCEYNNIADLNQGIVIQMLVRMNEYMYTMVQPENKPVDPAGDPVYHNETWVPWVEL